MNTHASNDKPWHLWAVAILSLLWDGAGAYTIFMAQAGKLPDISADEAAYYAAQPMWFVLVTDIALIAPLLAAVALLLRSRWAVTLFAIGLAAIVITHCYDLAAGTSRVFTNTTTVIVSALILVIATLQLWYALVMKKRGVLR
jgi:hypothetical protein